VATAPTSNPVGFTQLENLWIAAGGSRSLAPTAAAIAYAESSGNPNALNNTPSTGDYSVGLWQINYFGSLYPGRAARYGPPTALLGAQGELANAKAAVDLAGPTGAGFTNWTTYRTGAYKSFLGFDTSGALGSSSGGPLDTAAGGVTGAVKGVTGTIGSVSDAFKFIFSYRFLEILGGGLLILLGLYILAQQFQKVALAQGIPLPGPAKDAVAAATPARATVTPETRGQAAVDHQHREARASGEEGVRVLPSRRTAAPRPTMKRRVTTPAPSPTPARRRGVSSQPNRKPHGRQVRVKR
jgi:hypothetical protein